MGREWRVLIFLDEEPKTLKESPKKYWNWSEDELNPEAKNADPEVVIDPSIENHFGSRKEIVISGGSETEVLELARHLYPTAKSVQAVEFENLSGCGLVAVAAAVAPALVRETLQVSGEIIVRSLATAVDFAHSLQPEPKTETQDNRNGFQKLMNFFPRKIS